MTDHTSAEALRNALGDYDTAMDALGTCGDGNCVIKRPKGQHTNGGCHCYRDETRARRAMACASFLRHRIDAALSLSQAQGVTITDEMVERAHQKSRELGRPHGLGNWLSDIQCRKILDAALSTPTDRGDALPEEEAEEHISGSRL